MRFNYHTHTVRCRHAAGTEREYIENAIAAGFEILGFSDHSPQFYENGFVSGMRMLPEQAEEYINCIKGLADEYKGEIKIFAGFEAEYMPDYFEKLQRLCRDIGADYLIMGQHFIDREDGGIYVGMPSSDENVLKRYVDQVLEGLGTGSFTYLAHPDLCNFRGDADVYNSEMKRLCVGAKRLGIPLEINMLGLSGGRHYPSERFFGIAAECGNGTVIGCDAHTPTALSDTEMQNKTVRFARRQGCSLLESVELRKI